MPIPRDIRRLFYSAHWETVVRPAALERAGYRCQDCGLAHGAVGYRTHGLFHPVPVRRRRGQKLVIIRLQVAHANNLPGDDQPENLLALCARCHLLRDRGVHKQTRQAHKDAARPLIGLAVGAGE